MSASNKFSRSIRNFFRAWAADMNSGEFYDAEGKVAGWHSAGYVREDSNGDKHVTKAKDRCAESVTGNTIILKPRS